MSLSDVIASAQPVTLANFISSTKPVAGPGSISNLQPVFSPVIQQRHIGLVASFAQPTFGLLTSVGQPFGNVGSIKPLDYRNPIAAALTNSSQGGAERTVANTLAGMPGIGLASRPLISISQGGAERTVTNTLAAMPGNGLGSRPLISQGGAERTVTNTLAGMPGNGLGRGLHYHSDSICMDRGLITTTLIILLHRDDSGISQQSHLPRRFDHM